MKDSNQGLGRRPLAVAVSRLMRSAWLRDPTPPTRMAPPARDFGSPVHFERLEPRVLLSADLFPNALPTGLPISVIPAVHYTLPVEISNAGPDVILGPSSVSVHASVDGVLDAQDVLLGSATLSDLPAPGTSRTLNIDLNGALLTQPGTYTLITTVDPANAIAESNEGNNRLVSAGALEFSLAFGHVPEQGPQNHALTVTDADGSTATFTLQGAGYGELTPLVGGFALNLFDTDATTQIAITVIGGDGKLTLKGCLCERRGRCPDRAGCQF